MVFGIDGRIGFHPFFSPEDGGGGAPSGDAGGGVPAGGGGGGEPAGGAPATGSEPNAIDLSDDSLIRVKGIDKPVKYGDHVRGLQSRFTKSAQEAAQLKKQLQQLQTELQRRQQASPGPGAQGQGGGVNLHEQLAKLPYLSGKDAAEVVQAIGGELQRRDQLSVAMLKRLKAMSDTLSTLDKTHRSTAFESKMAGFLKDADLSEDWTDIAKEIYLAYEGDDLDQEFPRILRERVGQIEKAFEAKRERARQARPHPFVPGRGGEAKPSQPLKLKPDASAAEIADAMFPMLNTETGT